MTDGHDFEFRDGVSRFHRDTQIISLFFGKRQSNLLHVYIDLNAVRAGLAQVPKNYRSFLRYRGRFGLKRETGARPMRYGQWNGLSTMRDLRKAVIVAPAAG